MTYSNIIIYNLSLVLAGTEYSQALPRGLTHFEVKCRTLSDMKMAFISGASGTTFITIILGSVWYTKQRIPDGTTVTIYLQSETAGIVAEILATY